ncbi:MAG: hypothetical protein ACXWP5_13450, partial [Bdellovibrionota bacterium]
VRAAFPKLKAAVPADLLPSIEDGYHHAVTGDRRTKLDQALLQALSQAAGQIQQGAEKSCASVDPNGARSISISSECVFEDHYPNRRSIGLITNDQGYFSVCADDNLRLKDEKGAYAWFKMTACKRERYGRPDGDDLTLIHSVVFPSSEWTGNGSLMTKTYHESDLEQLRKDMQQAAVQDCKAEPKPSGRNSDKSLPDASIGGAGETHSTDGSSGKRSD